MVKITADSTCDLTPEIISELGVEIVPLYITAGDETFKDGVDITPDELFYYAGEQKKKCFTSAVNQFDYEKVFEKHSGEYESVVHFNISAEFSACHQNAAQAAKEFKNVRVVDTRSLSTGSGYIVQEAALMAGSGASADEIVAAAAEAIPKIDASFVIDRMDYLHRGGRCSGLEAVGAKILSIKPCIEVFEGKMRVGKKYRGSFQLSLGKYAADRLSNTGEIDCGRVYVTHPKCSAETVSQVVESIKKHARFAEIIETRAGCTISNHCGPNTLGIIFKRK